MKPSKAGLQFDHSHSPNILVKTGCRSPTTGRLLIFGYRALSRLGDDQRTIKLNKLTQWVRIRSFGASSAERALFSEPTWSVTRPPSPLIRSHWTTDTVWLTAVSHKLLSGVIDSRGVAIQKEGAKGGLRVIFAKDRSTKKTSKGHLKHFGFRSTKMRGSTAAKKLAINTKTLARVSALHKATCRAPRKEKNTDAPAS